MVVRQAERDLESAYESITQLIDENEKLKEEITYLKKELEKLSTTDFESTAKYFKA